MSSPSSGHVVGRQEERAGASAGMSALDHPTPPAALQRFGPLGGRVLLSMIFLMSGVMKVLDWSGTAEKMASEGMALVPLFLAGAIAFELVGGLSVLLGCYARLGALALVVFLIPTTLIFHDFWAYQGMEQQNQMQHFMKNLTIMGGLLVVTGLGPGRFSIDSRQGRA